MPSPILRRLGWFAAAIVSLVIILVGVIFVVSSARLSKTYDVTVQPVAIPSDSAALARGRHLATARLGCTNCHGAGLGGRVVAESDAFGHFIAPNITRGEGGVGSELTDADWVRAIRHGVRRDGKPMMFMPSAEFSRLSETDLAAVIAFVKQVPPADGRQPASRPGPIARALLTFNPGLLPAATINHEALIPAAPLPEVSPAYGEYLASTGGCRGCHGPDLAGNKAMEPGTPPPSNLTPGGPLGSWSEGDFIRALREGRRPDGSAIDPAMPWKAMGGMTDLELRAIFAYLKSVPSRATDA